MSKRSWLRASWTRLRMRRRRRVLSTTRNIRGSTRERCSAGRAAIAAAKEQGTTFKLRALVWVQGESDANASDSAHYEKGMNEMLAALRKDLEAPQLIALHLTTPGMVRQRRQ